MDSEVLVLLEGAEGRAVAMLALNNEALKDDAAAELLVTAPAVTKGVAAGKAGEVGFDLTEVAELAAIADVTGTMGAEVSLTDG